MHLKEHTLLLCAAMLLAGSTCGCGDQRVTYLPMGTFDARPCVDSSVSFYQRGQCQRAALKQEWLESYLVGITTAGQERVFDRNKLRVALPSIQRGLAEWGNACVGNVFTEGQPIYDATIFIYNGHIRGDTCGNVRYQFPVIAIPSDAYMPAAQGSKPNNSQSNGEGWDGNPFSPYGLW